MLKDAFTFEKLLKAHKDCRRCKQHKRETIMFELNLFNNLTKLSNDILNKTYKVGNYKTFKIFEPKERLIEALSYKDRLVLMALCTNVIQPKLEKYLIYDNVACRKNKGNKFGIERLHKFLRSYYRKYGSKGYFLKCDIKKYFQSINHNILLNKLQKTSLDYEDMFIIKTIINSRNQDTGVGLPIGNQTSQWFGLFYLNSIDRLIKEKLQIKYYVRYMDDMILVHHNKNYLKFCMQEIEKEAGALGLNLNAKTQIAKLSQGIDFLGFRHLLTNTGAVKQFLRGQAKTRLKKKLKFLGKLKEARVVDNEFVYQRLNAYKGYLKGSNTCKLFYKYKKKNNLYE